MHPAGGSSGTGDVLRQPGLVHALELLRDEGAASVYTGTIAQHLLALVDDRGGAVTGADLAAYRAAWREPAAARLAGRLILTRAGLSAVPETVDRLDPRGGADALLSALESAGTPDGHTTNVAAVDAEGSACVLTSSLGLGSGDFLPGLDLHLNSMLGEVDLVRGPLRPGERMGSMMAPTVALGADGLELALGAAGGTQAAHGDRRRARRGPPRGRADPGGNRPPALPSGRGHGARRAGRRRALARTARGGRADGAPVAGPAPLLRRRERLRAARGRSGSAPERRRGAALTAQTAGRTAARVSSTSRAICATRAASSGNARSSRRRRHSSTTSLLPYRSPSKSSRNASTRRSVPP